MKRSRKMLRSEKFGKEEDEVERKKRLNAEDKQELKSFQRRSRGRRGTGGGGGKR